MHKRKIFRRNSLSGFVSYTYLTILAALATFPLLWIILSAVKAKGELTSNPTAIWPHQFSLENFRIVLGQLNFSVNIVNSLIVAGCTTLIAITISSLGAYGVIRFFPRIGKVHHGQDRRDEDPRRIGSGLSFAYGAICYVAAGWLL